MESIIDKMKEYSDIINSPNEVRRLEALILSFRQKLPLYTFLTVGIAYDEHFNIKIDRQGKIDKI